MEDLRIPQAYNEHQPGLEVVSCQHEPGLEVAPPEAGLYPHLQPMSDKEAAGSQAPNVTDIIPGRDEGVKKRKKRLWLIGVVSACVLVAVLVGVLAGVLSRRSQSASASAPSSSATPTSSGPPPANMTGTSTVTTRYLFPTAVSWGYPHLEVLALTPDTRYSVYRKFRNSNATSDSDWKPAGGGFETVGGQINSGSSIAARSQTFGYNATDIFITGNDGGVYTKRHLSDENWDWDSRTTSVPDSWWEVDSKTAVSAPAVVTYNDLVIDMFVLANGSHNTIHHSQWTNASGWWANFDDLGGGDMQFVPAAVSWDGTRIDVFGISAANNHLFHNWWDGKSWQTFNGGLSAFEDLGGFCTSSPVAISRATGTLDVFTRGGDGGLWHLAYNGSWSAWTRIGGNTTIQAQPDALSWEADRIDVFAWGSDNSLLTTTFHVSTSQWTPADGFEAIGSDLSGPPKSVSDAAGSMHVFAYGSQGDLVWKSWNSSTGGKWPTGDFVQLGTPPF
ncbi:fucose-specific lectin [Diplogelasinospora grovesii]|uniref:Fucose-specific lectin n=1 Tax=Diplogelasinospora grovesii TaxID=303347 RepID=A0AAN6MXU9_9PEZI|nr:fucose-specific lectin [Diplogelasinospora grovesii]